MAVKSTSLSILLNRMKRWQAIARAEDASLVRDLDEALRTNRREIELPWLLQKGSLKVFDGVLEYPVPTDYDELAYLDDPRDESIYSARARFRFTSLKEFYENPDYRNDIAEIRDGNDIFLGVRYSPAGVASQVLNDAEDSDDFTGTDDVTAVAEDLVNYKKGNGSIKVSITSSAGTATIKNTFTTSFIDANYKKKYHFKWIYLDAVPTSIKLRYQVDDSNYLETTGITTQFSGQALKADAWNLIAQDLNTATAVGTVATTSTWASEKVILIGAATGTYYLDDSYIREWSLMDFWYYSKYQVALVGSTVANQEYFMDDDEVYSSDSKLIGDTEWADCIMYQAMLIPLADLKETETLGFVMSSYNKALEKLLMTYPSMKPLITTLKYRFITDFNEGDEYN